MRGVSRLFTLAGAIALFATMPALAQDTAPDGAIDGLRLPGLSTYAPPSTNLPLAQTGIGELKLTALMTEDGSEISRGIVWRVFSPVVGSDGKLPLIASAQGGSSVFHLEPGSYLVHASFGRAGATKRITVGDDPKTETVVLDAGGMKLDAILAGGMRIPTGKLSFSVYEADPDANGDRALIAPQVKPNTVVRLKAGTYHVVSTYGDVNAVIRSDIIVEAGKLTEATVEHRAAEVTLKLVREKGGEAIADTSWVVLSDAGDIVRESVGAFSSLVLAEGDYAVVAKNRDKIYQRDFTVEAGRNQDVEVLVSEAAADPAAE
ncbi:hypothetical protein [Aquamicrobium zhengzhouense]|uniref:Carboxypeptidase regulatory-like domain-containing protein n=1 Tax=Aquamicrobium zhengzhouense TaxID=2781738 RepID=A0ABS0S7I2_9HYPH|nr:hypothetical protein [Aquamicrobium zhengzhouense]